jgi:hypothetical protein
MFRLNCLFPHFRLTGCLFYLSLVCVYGVPGLSPNQASAVPKALLFCLSLGVLMSRFSSSRLRNRLVKQALDPQRKARTLAKLKTMTPYPPAPARRCPWCRSPVRVVYITSREVKACLCPPSPDRPDPLHSRKHPRRKDVTGARVNPITK